MGMGGVLDAWPLGRSVATDYLAEARRLVISFAHTNINVTLPGLIPCLCHLYSILPRNFSPIEFGFAPALNYSCRNADIVGDDRSVFGPCLDTCGFQPYTGSSYSEHATRQSRLLFLLLFYGHP